MSVATPRYPIFIPSKGRAEIATTPRNLEEYGVDYRIIVEGQEYDDYAAVWGEHRLLLLDPAYQENYDTFDRLGGSKSRGPGAARNQAWDTAIAEGFERHWVMDDNLLGFWRMHLNRKIRYGDASAIVAMEDFSDRYENLAMSGPQYYMFAPRKSKLPPFVTNTRIYSCNLILNEAPFRWRGRYNEDTDLSLRMLKAGWTTVQFNAFLQWKMTTQLLRGGNSAEFYDREGTRAKSDMLVKMHPDVARHSRRFSRDHHTVDYSGFQQALVRKPGLVIPKGVNNYGVRLAKKV